MIGLLGLGVVLLIMLLGIELFRWRMRPAARRLRRIRKIGGQR